MLLVSELPAPVEDVELPAMLPPLTDCEPVELEYVDEDFVLLGGVDAEVALEVEEEVAGVDNRVVVETTEEELTVEVDVATVAARRELPPAV